MNDQPTPLEAAHLSAAAEDRAAHTFDAQQESADRAYLRALARKGIVCRCGCSDGAS